MNPRGTAITATPASSIHPSGWWEPAAFVTFCLIALAFAGLATWANTDLMGPRPFLFMDEMIPYDGVKRILTADSWSRFGWAVCDGGDHRYGRIFYNLTALFSALPYRCFGDEGLVVSIRSTQVLFLLGAYVVFCRSLLSTWLARAIGLLLLCSLPFTGYYLTQPKPEPLQLLLIACFLDLAMRRRFAFGGHWLLLGLAFGAKISAAPLCLAAGLAGLGAAWLDRTAPSQLIRPLLLALGSFLAGWLIAVPFLAVPTWAHINTYLDWTFRSTAHPFDNASVDAAAWLRSMLDGTDAFKFYLQRKETIPLFIALGIFLICRSVEEISRRSTWRTSWFSFKEWILLGFAALLLLPIIFAVKRIWGLYLHPGEVLVIIALVTMGEKAWREPSPAALLTRLTRLASCLGLVVVSYVLYQMTPAIRRDYQSMAERTRAPVHIRNAEVYREIIGRLRKFAAHQKKTIPDTGDVRVYHDPFIYLPDSEPGLDIQPYWVPFKFWAHDYEVVVMGWNLHIGYYTGGKPLPPATSAMYADLVAARDQFVAQVETGSQNDGHRPYQLAGWIGRDAAIIVRADLVEAWKLSTREMPPLSLKPKLD